MESTIKIILIVLTISTSAFAQTTRFIVANEVNYFDEDQNYGTIHELFILKVSDRATLMFQKKGYSFKIGERFAEDLEGYSVRLYENGKYAGFLSITEDEVVFNIKSRRIAYVVSKPIVLTEEEYNAQIEKNKQEKQ
jgi:hypothetical protein